ncbi:MFS transporter [Corynebacterium sp. 3HC-13]|uniref:MFS transporter n=1 Tax=Corynebacterium poyangense TaxID=2684405 RepID=UPI001CCA7223|nr:MFS transporter [Corynebacterium poyangense]MBZ8177674.1 MFS transporter [Corynebacterium poyangense]
MTTSSRPLSTTHEVEAKEVRKIAFSAFIGTALEWYDFFLFGTASALVFNHLYFAGNTPATATLASFAAFGVGFLARPLGAVFFGKLGDKWGRRPALILSIVVIGLATGLVGCLPDYFSIGIAAPILLTALRLFQGVAVGGEWGGATTLAIEHAPARKRGRYAALVQMGSPIGTLMSSGAFALVFMLPPETVDVWGWRLPFLAAFPFLGIALWIRLQVEESPVFQQLAEEAEENQGSLAELFRGYTPQIFWATCAALLGIGGFFVMTTYILSYGTTVLGLERQSLVNATVIAAAVEIFILLIFGRVAERLGAHKVIVVGGALTAIFAWPIWKLIDTGNLIFVSLAIVVGISLVSIPYAVIGVLLGHMFEAKLRYTGMAISYNFSGAIAGLLPFIATWMNGFYEKQSSTPAIIILIAISLLTMVGGIYGGRHYITDDVQVKEA